MLNDIYLHIQAHLSLLDMALNTSDKIKFFASTGDIDQVISETENRERLLNVITQIQSAVETKIGALGPHDLEEDSLIILKTWFSDLAAWSEKMIELDRETVELLNQHKEDTTKEIATIFKNKEMFKGYNHSVKK
jgi:hypothetical protein